MLTSWPNENILLDNLPTLSQMQLSLFLNGDSLQRLGSDKISSSILEKKLF